MAVTEDVQIAFFLLLKHQVFGLIYSCSSGVWEYEPNFGIILTVLAVYEVISPVRERRRDMVSRCLETRQPAFLIFCKELLPSASSASTMAGKE
jgi:hypothetical protein